nr:hypothetical protein [Tanacetum cinerariifolium]
MWLLKYLSTSAPSKGRFKTTPPSPNVIKSLIQVPQQGQVTHTKNKKTIVVDKNGILTCEIQPHMKPWVDIIRENVICQGDDEELFYSNSSSPSQNVSSTSNVVSRVLLIPNGKLIHNSIFNGPYVRRMIPEPGDGERDNVGNQAVQNPRVQNVGNPNGLMGVQGNGNQNQIGN